MMNKYENNPYLKLLNTLPPVEALRVRSEYTQAAYDKLNEEDKAKMKSIIRQLTKLHNLGELGAIQLLATLGQVFDAADWPRKND